MFTIARDCAKFCSRVAHPYHVFTRFRLWSLLVATLLEFLYLAEKLGGSVCESNAPATGVTRRPPVLKTGQITGLDTLPSSVFNILSLLNKGLLHIYC